MRIHPHFAPLLALGTLLAACSSGNDADEQIERSSSDLRVCQTCGHPLNEETPCPAGDSCSVTAVNLPPPISGCTTPTWFTESGATTASYSVSLCPTGAALTTWISGQETVVTTSTVPTFYPAAEGTTYVTYAPLVPGGMPVSPTCGPNDSCPTAEGIEWTDPSGNPLPCSQIYAIPDSGHAGGMWAAYCVETPAVDAWVTDFKGPVLSAAGEVTLAADVAVAAPYGYVYLAWWWDEHLVIIGGGCSSSCIKL